MTDGNPSSAILKGALPASIAYVIFGTSSLYWHLLARIPAAQLLAFRVLTSLVTLFALMAMLKKVGALMRAARSPRTVGIYVLTGLSIAVNWGTFIWGSVYGHVIETGIGYLIAPLMNIAFGALFLRESITAVKRAAIVVMILGVAILALRSGELKVWIYLSIGISFGLYSFLRKVGPLDPLSGLTLETCILALLVLVASVAHAGGFTLKLPGDTTGGELALLAIAGIISVTPLWLFSIANRNMSLTSLGFFQYILPTTQLLLAIFYYGQTRSTNTLICFGIIWSALFMVLAEALFANRRMAVAMTKAAT